MSKQEAISLLFGEIDIKMELLNARDMLLSEYMSHNDDNGANKADVYHTYYILTSLAESVTL